MIVYREVSTLSVDLGVSVKMLYAVSNNIAQHYHLVKIPKHDNTFRQLSVPDEELKHIQRRITQHLLLSMPISRYATAYRFGSSIFRNAVPHVGKSQLLKLDIFRFFDSILYSMVKNAVFPVAVFSEPLRILLTMLCYYRESLPQGAPSSPAISNIIMRPFDEKIGAWCAARGIAYTRYCDDMTFSGLFDEKILTTIVCDELRTNGFFLNAKKTQNLRAGQRQTVTGLTVNEAVNIPADYRKKLEQELYYAHKFGIEAHLHAIGRESDPKKYCKHLLGRVNYVLQGSHKNTEMLFFRRWLAEQLCQPNHTLLGEDNKEKTSEFLT